MRKTGLMTILIVLSGVVIHSREQGYIVESAPSIVRMNNSIYILAHRKSNISKQGTFIIVDDKARRIKDAFVLTDLLVDGNDIYMVGEVDNSVNHGAAYWKNEQVYPLGKSGTLATAICKYRDDIYISGYTESSNYRPCYWKNGDIVLLENKMSGNDIAVANSIFADKKGVLVCGFIYYNSTQNYAACFWENGNRKNINGAFAKKILRHDGKIYIAGEYYKNKGVLSACYWINGKRFDLDGVTANSMYIFRNRVYIAGSYTQKERMIKACYWIDGVRHDLPFEEGDNYASAALAVFADADGVYVSGDDRNNTRAVYWINEEQKKITLPFASE